MRKPARSRIAGLIGNTTDVHQALGEVFRKFGIHGAVVAWAIEGHGENNRASTIGMYGCEHCAMMSLAIGVREMPDPSKRRLVEALNEAQQLVTDETEEVTISPKETVH
jgi:hypothetical protein